MDEALLDAADWVEARTEEWIEASAEYARALREWEDAGGPVNVIR